MAWANHAKLFNVYFAYSIEIFFWINMSKIYNVFSWIIVNKLDDLLKKHNNAKEKGKEWQEMMGMNRHVQVEFL